MDNQSNLIIGEINHESHQQYDIDIQNQKPTNHQNEEARNKTRRFSLFDNKIMPDHDSSNQNPAQYSAAAYKYFESIVTMVEPIEFYTIRQKASPKAPSRVRICTSFLFLFASIIVFALVINQSLSTYTVETDIFRKLPSLDEWDNCDPITTLGSNWTPYSLYAIDDTNFKQIRYYLRNMWFHNTTSCQSTLGPSWKNFCSLQSDGGVLFKFNNVVQDTYGSAMCNGVNLIWQNRGKPSDCSENYIEIWIKYWNPTSGDYYNDCYGTNTDPGYINMCQAIFDSTNPYKCTRKIYTSIVDSLSNGYAFATLAFTVAVICITTLFPLLFKETNEIDIES